MLFNSIEYLLFLPVVVALHFALPHRWRWALLLAASWYFYARWNAAYLPLIWTSTGVAWACGLGLGRVTSERARRALLVLCVGSNLGLLFVFKYWNFFAESLAALSGAVGLPGRLPGLDTVLPVGISFYTFQTLSYAIDLYRGAVPVERNLGRFALYVAFFPQLVAGPIERARSLLPQMWAQHRFSREAVVWGLQLILWGLFKKVVIADRLALYVDAVYSNVGQHNGTSFALATYAFAFQIYCDFSGYSDIAIGSAGLLGFRLMDNFQRPYFATGVRDFWRRWHISLSTWLRDYLYVPLGGNRRGPRRTYVNLLATMLLGGLWHGASWNFVIWGALHGLFLAFSRLSESARDRLWARSGAPAWLRDGLRGLITFHLVCLAWIFFRAETLADSVRILRGLAGDWGPPFMDLLTLANGALGLAVLLFAEIVQVRRGSGRAWLATLPLPLRWACWYALLFGIVLLGVDGGAQFIYFQF